MTPIARSIAALALACALALSQTRPLTCAGGTFPAPIYQKWIEDFQAQNPGTAIVYRAVGSEQAIQDLQASAVDFAASDFPPTEPVQAKLGIHLVPTLVGAAVPVYNLPNMVADLRFTPDLLAGIYLGKITRWNDPRIKELNKHTALPSGDIVVVHRSDGSGTTYVWTDLLSQANSEWKENIGASISPQWPAGRGETGNEGVAAFVSRTPFSIGYVEFFYALRAHLTYGSVRNPAGAFVQATIDSLTAAASRVGDNAGNRISIVNAPGRNSYPLCSFTWFLIPVKMSSGLNRQRLRAFLDWALTKGQDQVAALGYVPLPQSVAERERDELVDLWKSAQ